MAFGCGANDGSVPMVSLASSYMMVDGAMMIVPTLDGAHSCSNILLRVQFLLTTVEQANRQVAITDVVNNLRLHLRQKLLLGHRWEQLQMVGWNAVPGGLCC